MIISYIIRHSEGKTFYSQKSGGGERAGEASSAVCDSRGIKWASN